MSSLFMKFLIFFLPTIGDSTEWLRFRGHRSNIPLNPPFDICHSSRPTYDQYRRPFDYYRLFRCSCDSNCNLYGECCDLKSVSSSSAESNLSCEPVFGSDFFIYTISKCPVSWDSDSYGNDIRNRCELSDHKLNSSSFLEKIIVHSSLSNRFYRNIFCAVCNIDAYDLTPWSPKLICPENITETGNGTNQKLSSIDIAFKGLNSGQNSCKIIVTEFNYPYLIHSLGARPCRQRIDVCSNGLACPSYTYYVYSSHTDPNESPHVYRNLPCARCNDVPKENLTGYYDIRFFFRPLSSATNGQSVIWFPLLLDFNFISPRKGSWVAGSKIQLCPLTSVKSQAIDSRSSDCSTSNCAGFYFSEKESCTDLEFEPIISSERENKRINLSACSKGVSILTNNNGDKDSATNLTDNTGRYPNQSISLARICLNGGQLAVPVQFSQFQATLSELGLYISIVCLILQIGVHSLVVQLRNVPGKNLISLSVALLASHVSFLVSGHLADSPGTWPCKVFSIATHYTYLSVFFWMSVMSFDIYRTFCTKYALDHWVVKRNDRLFLKYSLYSWLSPGFIVAIAIICDLYAPDSIYQPLYGYRMCWINRRTALLIFLASPLAAIITINMVFYIRIAVRLGEARRSSKILIKISDKIRFILYLKLALLMGFTWILGFIASLSDYDILWYPFIIMNGLQGAFIFTAFTMKPKIIKLIKKRICETSRETSATPGKS